MNYLDYFIIVAYLSGLLWLGHRLKTQNGKQSYFLGGRGLSWQPLTLSVMATQLSAISFVSAPAFVGLREGGGLKWLSYELALPLAMILLLGTLAPTLYRSGVVSIYDLLERRFSRSTRVLISLVFQISRAFATGMMIYTLSIILQGTMGIPAWLAVLLTGLITILYSLQGGMKAVVYGDALQMIIIILGTLACIAFGLYYLGGFEVLQAQVASDRLQAIDANAFGLHGDGFGLLPMLTGGLILYASYYGCDQTEAQRTLSAKDENTLRKVLLANGLLRFPITLLYCLSGLVIGTLAMSDAVFMANIPADKPDWMIPVFILHYLPHGLIGLLVVAILAAAMSSLSSAINSLSAVTLEDYCRLSGKSFSEDSYLRLAKGLGLFWGVLTLVLSLYAGNIAATVIEAINKIGSIFYGPVLAIFLLAVLPNRLQASAVNLGLLSGVGLNLYLWLMQPQIFWFWWNVTGFVSTLLISAGAFWCLPNTHGKDPKSPAPQWVFHSVLTKFDAGLLCGMFIFMLLFCLYVPTYLFAK